VKGASALASDGAGPGDGVGSDDVIPGDGVELVDAKASDDEALDSAAAVGLVLLLPSE
jgi:hypothetical protein